MAQPKNRRRREDEAKKNPNRVELENLQRKADGIVQRRNDFNAQAAAARDERNLLNDKRAQLFDQMEPIKQERDGHNAKMREAIAIRNEFQAQAKALIQQKRARFKKDQKPGQKLPQNPHFRARELLAEINDLEFSQQTRVLTIQKENELIKQLRLKQHEYVKVRREAEQSKKLKVDVGEAETAIDALFAKADEQHKIVQAEYKLAQEAHDRYVKLVNEVGSVGAEANKHHKHFIELRGKADDEHKAFLELREKMLELKGKEFADRREAREEIKAQSRRVRQAVADPNKLGELAEDALAKLKKGGKIQIG